MTTFYQGIWTDHNVVIIPVFGTNQALMESTDLTGFTMQQNQQYIQQDLTVQL